MDELALADLIRLLRECADQDESVSIDLNKEVFDMSFENLGFDSLSIFNVLIRIERDYGVELSYDDIIVQTQTPRALLRVINNSLQALKERQKKCAE